MGTSSTPRSLRHRVNLYELKVRRAGHHLANIAQHADADRPGLGVVGLLIHDARSVIYHAQNKAADNPQCS